MIEKRILTATEEVLLAAGKLTNFSEKEFTEWDLTVETWRLNKDKWGLRGYESNFPDHKRVMNEIMAKGTQKVVGKGWLKRTRKNHYCLTPAGIAKAESISGIKISFKKRSLQQYDAISQYINHRIFKDYCEDSNEPKTWLGAASFLGLSKYDPNILDCKMKIISNVIYDTLDWFKKNKEDVLYRDDSSKPITKKEVLNLEKFLSILEKRFEAQFKAIRAKKK